MKRGSIELARSQCEEIKGELPDGEQYGSVDVAEILSAHVRRLQSELVEAVAANATLHDTCRGYEARLQSLYLGSGGCSPEGYMCIGECERYIELNREKLAEATHLRMQIGYIVAELQVAGDKRSTPEIVEAAAKATKTNEAIG